MGLGAVGASYRDADLLQAWERSVYDDVAKATTLDDVALALSGSLGAGKRPNQPYAQIPAFFACIRVTAEAVKHMPFNIATADDELVESGDVVDLVNCPYPGLTGEDFWDMTITYSKTRGCYWVVRDGGLGVPTKAIEPVMGDRVKPLYDDYGGLTGYKVWSINRRHFDIIEPDLVEPVIIHNIYGRGLFDPMSPAEPADSALSQIYGADRANLTVLDNGGEPGMVFEMGQEPSETVKKDFKSQVQRRWQSPDKRNLPIVLWGSAQLKELTRKFSDMEFSTLKRMAIVDICAVNQTPPSVIGYYEDSNKAHSGDARIGWIENTILPLANTLARKFTLFALRTYQVRARSRVGRKYIQNTARKTRDLVSPTHTVQRTWSKRHRVGVVEDNAVLGRKAIRQEPLALFGYFDSSTQSEVQETMLSRMERALKFKELGATLDDIIEQMDLPIRSDHLWQKKAYRTLGEVPYDEEEPGDSDPDGSVQTEPAPEEADDPEKSATRALPDQTVAKNLSEMWKLWRSSWKPLEKELDGKVSRTFNELFAGMLRRIEERRDEIELLQGDKALAARVASLPEIDWDLYQGHAVERLGFVDEQRADIADLVGKIIFDLFEADDTLVGRTTSIFKASIQLGGEQTRDEHSRATQTPAAQLAPFAIDSPAVREAMNQRKVKIKGANRTVRNRVKRTLVEGLAKGESVDDIAKRIRHERGISVRRSRTIAFTETSAAVEQGRHEGRKQFGVPGKSWLWSQRETARPWHRATSTETIANPIPNDQYFVLAETGARAMHPRAANLEAKEVVNCGCMVIGRYPGDSIKSFTQLYTRAGFLTHDQLMLRTKEASDGSQ